MIEIAGSVEYDLGDTLLLCTQCEVLADLLCAFGISAVNAEILLNAGCGCKCLACHIIYKLCAGKGNMYAVIKAVLRKLGAPDIGGVRAPLTDVQPGDEAVIDEAADMIRAALAELL